MSDLSSKSATVRMVRPVFLLSLPLCLTSPGGTIAMTLLGIFGLILMRNERPMPDAIWLFRIAGGLYMLLVLVDILNGDIAGVITATAVNYLPLIAISPVLVALRAGQVSISDIRFCVVLAILIAFLALIVYAINYSKDNLEPFRVQGLALNSIPFGLVVGALGLFCLSDWLASRDAPSCAMLALAFAAFGVIVGTGSKLVWASVGTGYIVATLTTLLTSRNKRSVFAAGGLVALGIISLSLAFVQRELVAFTTSMSALLSGGDAGSSVGLRVSLLELGLSATETLPPLGYGMSDLMGKVISRAENVSAGVLGMSHLHNDFLIHWLAFGLPGIAFLLGFFAMMIWAAKRAQSVSARVFILAFVPTLGIYMAFDIIFNNDATTALVGLMLPLALHFGARVRENGTNGRDTYFF